MLRLGVRGMHVLYSIVPLRQVKVKVVIRISSNAQRMQCKQRASLDETGNISFYKNDLE